MREIDPDGFRELWPILFLQRSLPTAEPANAALERLIVAREAARPELTTAYREGNLFSEHDSAIAWLAQCIHKTATDYCRRAGMDYPIDWSLHGWANVNRLGDYHDPHNHPHAYLSGTYYVRVPASRATPRNRADVRPGCISLYDPRVTNMSAIRDDPQSNPELTIAPAAGMILMWPAYLMHFVHPNLADEPRISVSFNLKVKDLESHLPRQG
ncbi:MAG: TIGR02466 family protein [Burkholderiales bacterium]